MGKNRRCQWAGCRKIRQHGPSPAVYCRKHQATGKFKKVESPTTPAKLVDLNMRLLRPKKALFHTIKISTADLKHFLCEHSPISHRVRYHLPVERKIHSLINKITEEYVIPCLPTRFKYHSLPTSGVYVIAPPHSNSVKGIIHRDCDTIEEGYYSVVLCVDKVTEENGCIHFWPRTELIPLHEKVRSRAVACHRSKIFSGDAGTLCLFDARTLHQSQRNNTDKSRVTVQWFVHRSTLSLDILV